MGGVGDEYGVDEAKVGWKVEIEGTVECGKIETFIKIEAEEWTKKSIAKR
jgi:hypothetical protein